jgi:hypothetical protein
MIIIAGGFVARRHGAHALLVVLAVIAIPLINNTVLHSLMLPTDFGADWLFMAYANLSLGIWLVLASMLLLRARTVAAQVRAGRILVVIPAWLTLLVLFPLATMQANVLSAMGVRTS